MAVADTFLNKRPASPEQLRAMLDSCRLCGRRCGAGRSRGQTGFCGAGCDVEISSSNLHFGEEPPISGERGSGTIFFARCSLGCVFCQNYPISALAHGRKITVEKLAGIMLELAAKGAHNINLVSPTHYAPQAAEAALIARAKGLSIPIVYNTGGYDTPETIDAMEGIVDVYMPDMKYSDARLARLYSGAADYPEVNKAAVTRMFRQVGHLATGAGGIAEKGLIIRHLVLPGSSDDSKKVLDFIAEKLSPEIFVSVMSQYHPAHKSHEYPALTHKLSEHEYEEAVTHAEKLGLENAFIQYL